MKKKIVGILVVTLLIVATALPVAGNVKIGSIKEKQVTSCSRSVGTKSLNVQPPDEEWDKTFGGGDFADLQRLLRDLEIKFYNSGSIEERIEIIEETVLLLDEYGQLPDDMSLNQALQLVDERCQDPEVIEFLDRPFDGTPRDRSVAPLTIIDTDEVNIEETAAGSQKTSIVVSPENKLYCGSDGTMVPVSTALSRSNSEITKDAPLLYDSKSDFYLKVKAKGTFITEREFKTAPYYKLYIGLTLEHFTGEIAPLLGDPIDLPPEEYGIAYKTNLRGIISFLKISKIGNSYCGNYQVEGIMIFTITTSYYCDMYVPGEIIVVFKNNVTKTEAVTLVESYNLVVIEFILWEVFRATLVKVPFGEEWHWIEILESEEIVKYAEPNYIFHPVKNNGKYSLIESI